MCGYGNALKQSWVRWIHLCILVQAYLAWNYVKPDLSKTVSEPHMVTEVFGLTLPMGGFDGHAIRNLVIVMVLLFVFFGWVSRNLQTRPGRLQLLVENIVLFFQQLCIDTLGEMGRPFIPYIGTIFLMIWSCNMLGVVPPFLHEPTANMNVPIGMGLMAFIISHAVALRHKGFIEWIKPYFLCLPLKKWMPSPINLYIPNPLEIIGEAGKVISHSMRLFGNIFGGVIIMIVVSNLLYYFAMPTFLTFFFGIFVGTVQAFVFAMLALVYTSVLVAEE
jgi:F-type H+-transporting ATPase subunit a